MNSELSPYALKALEEVRQRINQRRERTAHHEAGHAVMAELQGFPVLRISILPEGNTRGRCVRTSSCYCGLEETEARRLALKEMLVFYSGHAAESLMERHHAPHTIDYITANGGGIDHKNAWALLPKIINDLDADATCWEKKHYFVTARALLNYQVARAYKIIRSKPYKTVVKALANELLGWDELTGDEARDIMVKALPETDRIKGRIG